MSIRYDISLGMRLLRALPIVLFYLGLIFLVFALLPASAKKMPLESLVVIGFVGAARYLWLITHCTRAAIFEHYVYPRIRFAISQMREEEKYPQRVFFLIPTWREKPEVSRQMLTSVLDEVGRVPCNATILVNAGSDEEDDLFREVVKAHREGSKVRMIFVRQQGGKRQGMADSLNALMDYDIEDDDCIVLMDGDTVLGQGILEKCLPLFQLRPKLGAVTTDNISVTEGNALYRKWYTLRFSMRHRMMKSQSLSNQLLVLTGRFSVFRAKYCMEDEFIAYLENDRMNHWLQGEIKFVTGDDKSTWFCLLKQGCQMLYVPDAHIYCMEDSGKRPLSQSTKKMHRWFGNMLRNNPRAIALGMGSQASFIWWCSIDQRISMFTSVLGPLGAFWAAIWLSPYYLIVYAMLVVLVRLIYSMILVMEGHRLSIWDIPLLLYTQWVGAIIKIYTSFHLHHQKWDDHRTDAHAAKHREPFLNALIPKMQIAFSFTLMVLFVAMVIGTK